MEVVDLHLHRATLKKAPLKAANAQRGGHVRRGRGSAADGRGCEGSSGGWWRCVSAAAQVYLGLRRRHDGTHTRRTHDRQSNGGSCCCCS